MNLIVLLVGLRPWAATPVERFARVTGAIALLSLEMQVVTWSGHGSLTALVALNLLLAAVAFLAWAPRRGPTPRAAAPLDSINGSDRLEPSLPWVAILIMAALAALLAVTVPLSGADPYHLERVVQILRLGSLAYDPGAELKVNVLASSYELVLADLRQVPAIGAVLLRLHGVLSLAYFTLGVAAVRQWMPGGRTWCWSALFVMPVVFHQLVLVKNDLYSATPAFVALCWLASRAAVANPLEIGWASALVGLAVAMKWVSFPLALVTLATVWLTGRRDWRLYAATLAGGAAGALAGGLPFTLVETARVYGHPFAPLAALGNRTTSVADALTSVLRFAISLGDFDLITKAVWPGRGGWGATFGAPLIWALAALVTGPMRSTQSQRALMMAVAYWAVFAAIYPDADVGHRLVLAPALLLVAVAAGATDDESRAGMWRRRALLAALVVSAVQIARSAVLYVTGAA